MNVTGCAGLGLSVYVQVVVGAGDPNPLVGGAGIATLRKAGIEVVEGVEAAACYDVNRAWMERMAATAAAAVKETARM